MVYLDYRKKFKLIEGWANEIIEISFYLIKEG